MSKKVKIAKLHVKHQFIDNQDQKNVYKTDSDQLHRLSKVV